MAQLDSDAQIQEAVLREIRWDPRIEGTKFAVAVDQGVVTLMGVVGGFTEKWVAQETAYGVAGVIGVANDLQVRLEGSRTRTNTEIVQAARQALKRRAHIASERIRVMVSEGSRDARRPW